MSADDDPARAGIGAGTRAGRGVVMSEARQNLIYARRKCRTLGTPAHAVGCCAGREERTQLAVEKADRVCAGCRLFLISGMKSAEKGCIQRRAAGYLLIN